MEMRKVIESILDEESDWNTDEGEGNIDLMKLTLKRTVKTNVQRQILGSIEEQKEKLKRQIDQLKLITMQTELALNMSKFSETKCVIHSPIPSLENSDTVLDIDLQLEYELHKYSGFYCTKCTNTEYIFNISTSNKYDKDNTFAVQILNDKGKLSLGKWIMPMSVNLNDLLKEFPINRFKDMAKFLHICKHYITCYTLRYKQFMELMDKISDIKNCNAQANLGYTYIMLELMGVYDKSNDKYMHIIIYLTYEIDEIIPNSIKIDTNSEKKLDKNTRRELKESLMYLKQLDLPTAFDNILREEDEEESFMWSREKDEDSVLELGDSDGSGSTGFLDEISLSSSTELPRRGKRKVTKNQGRTKKRKTSRLLDSGENSILSQGEETEEEKEAENSMQHSASKRDSSITESLQTVNKSKQGELKQRKLEFASGKLGLSTNKNVASSDVTSPKKKPIHEKQSKAITSTPKHRRRQDVDLIIPSTDISDIETIEGSLENMKKKMNVNSPKTTLSGSESNTPKKLLKNKLKRNVRSKRK